MANKIKVSVVSGGFDPLHSGHIEYFKSAKAFGDILIIALNSDAWLVKKKGKYFLPFEERKIILENLKMVHSVISFDDDDSGSCTLGLLKIKEMYPTDEIIFCNGGDRNITNSIEQNIKGIKHLSGVGGSDKKNSSSWILNNYYDWYT